MTKANVVPSVRQRMLTSRNRQMRVLYILLEVPETNSPYNELALGLLDRCDIALCTFFEPAVPMHQSIRVYSGDKTVAGFFRALKSAFSAADYDIIHAHTPHVGLLLLLRIAFNRRLRSSVVHTVHNSYKNHKFRNKLLLLPNFAFSKRVVCCGRAAYESFPSVYRRLAGRRFRFVPNGVDWERIDRAKRTAPPTRGGGRFTVVSVGRLVKIKNLHTALKAYHATADSTAPMIFVGDGPERAALQQYVKEHDLQEIVTFTGLITRDEAFEQLLAADVFLSASYGEGLPVAALEAMASGSPVILSDIPPHREIVEGIDFIPLIHPDDIAGFADEIKRLREMSPADRAALGEAGRKHVEEHFGLSSMLAGYEQVYDEVLAAKTGGRHPE